MNLPNKLSFLRIILVPLFMLFLFLRNDFPVYADILALVTFVAAAITDGLDGYIARREQIITKLGKILDPLADKLLITSALIVFVAMNDISAWAAFLIIGRELAVTGLRVIAASEGIIISANQWGKWKTTLQITAIIYIIVHPVFFFLPAFLATVLIWLAVVITIISGIIYFKSADIDFFGKQKIK